MAKAERTSKGGDWTKLIEKEAIMRSKWFKANEERLYEIANTVPSRIVPTEIKEKLKQDRIATFQNAEKHPRIQMDMVVSEFTGDIQDMMRPVDPTVTKLIYSGSNQDGRINYLKERTKLLPEMRYYFPEVSSFEYGWKMWDVLKNMDLSKFGRQKVIQTSFYRRRGVERDPEWYREPANTSQTICNRH